MSNFQVFWDIHRIARLGKLRRPISAQQFQHCNFTLLCLECIGWRSIVGLDKDFVNLASSIERQTGSYNSGIRINGKGIFGYKKGELYQHREFTTHVQYWSIGTQCCYLLLRVHLSLRIWRLESSTVACEERQQEKVGVCSRKPEARLRPIHLQLQVDYDL